MRIPRVSLSVMAGLACAAVLLRAGSGLAASTALATPIPPTAALPPDGAGITLVLPEQPPSADIRVVCGLPGDDGWCRMPVKVVLLGTASGSPIARLDYVLDGTAATQDGAAWEYEDGQNGEHTLSLSAVDRLGRISAAANASYRLDRSLPEASFLGADGDGLHLHIADQGSGLTRWTVQVFDGNGASVFYHEAAGPFDGALPWTAPEGVFEVELFARDAAGNEVHFPRTAFAGLTPTPPPSLLQQAVQLFIPLPASSPTPPATPAPANTTAAPLHPATPAATVTPSGTPGPETTPAPVPAPRDTQPILPAAAGAALRSEPDQGGLRLLALASLLGLLLAWCLAAGLDRRAGALEALAGELSHLAASRLRDGGPR